jgi:hypothetical protein
MRRLQRSPQQPDHTAQAGFHPVKGGDERILQPVKGIGHNAPDRDFCIGERLV